MTLTITFHHQAAAGGAWLPRFIGRLQYRRMGDGGSLGGTVGISCRIAAGDAQSGCKMASWRIARPNNGTILTCEDQSRLTERTGTGRGSGHRQRRVIRMTKIRTIRHGTWRGGWAPP